MSSWIEQPRSEPAAEPMSQPSPAPPSRPRRVPLRRRPAWAWLRLFRPVALLTGVGVALGAAFTLDNGSPAWHEALAVAIVMAGLLAAASAFNDAEDAEFDRDAHVWRPIPAGFVTVPQAQRAAAAWALAALIAAATLGWIPFLLALATVALAYLHSARLKPGNFAWIAWALAFALDLGVIAQVARDHAPAGVQEADREPLRLPVGPLPPHPIRLYLGAVPRIIRPRDRLRRGPSRAPGPPPVRIPSRWPGQARRRSPHARGHRGSARQQRQLAPRPPP